MQKTRLTEMEKNRINEVRLQILVWKWLENYNNDFALVQEYIRSLANFLEFDENIIIDIMQEVLSDRYSPTVDEVIKINLLFGITIREIAERLNMNESTVKMHIYRNKNNINTIILYPRLENKQSQELRRFFKQYYKLYVVPYKIFGTEKFFELSRN